MTTGQRDYALAEGLVILLIIIILFARANF